MNDSMKPFCFFLFSLVAFASLPCGAQFRPGYAELGDSERVSSLKSHVSYIASAARQGRKAGSEGETETASYVFDVLESYGLDMLCLPDGDLFGIRQEGGDTLTSRNVLACVQGYDSKLKNHYIVVGARMDNIGTNTLTVNGEDQTQIYYGANGNASGLAMLLELAKMVKTNEILLRRSVIFIAFGASAETYAGAWYFMNRSFGEAGNVDAMINLDMLGTGAGNFCAYTASNPDMNNLLAKVSGELQPVYPTVTTIEPYPSDHRAFYSAAVPSVFFTTGRYSEHDSPRDTEDILQWKDMEAEMEYIYSFIRTIAAVDDAPAFSAGDVNRREIEGKLYAYYNCDDKPAFLGHSDPKYFLQKWVYQYLKYPDQAIKDGIQGRVEVEFTIDKKGKVTDARVTRSVHPLLDEEALKVVNASPDWRPGRVKGVRVDAVMSIPIEFRLEKKGKRSFGINKR